MSLNTENIENVKPEDLTNQITADEISLEDAGKVVGGACNAYLTIDGVRTVSGPR